MRWLALLMLTLLAGPARADEAGPPSLVDTVLRPAAAGYRAATEPLARAIREGCADPARRERIARAFAAAVAAWGRLQPLLQGPLGDAVLASRIAFWPDRHGTAARQIAAALASADPALADPAALAGRSAALSSLHALERVLFPESAPAADGPETRRALCGYAHAIAVVQDGLGQEAAKRLAQASRDPGAMVQGAFATIRDALDGILRLKLEDPLGRDLRTARGTRAELWRSGSSLAVIDANLATLQALMRAPGGLGERLALGPESAAVAAVIEDRLARAREAAAAIPLPLREAVEDPAARARVEALADQIRELRARVVERLGPTLGVASGFNALDGD